MRDLYIRRMDRCETVEEIFELHSAMFSDLTSRMKSLTLERTYALPVHKVLEYISRRLQEPLTVAATAWNNASPLLRNWSPRTGSWSFPRCCSARMSGSRTRIRHLTGSPS